jgi:hyperosmotically inducible protein
MISYTVKKTSLRSLILAAALAAPLTAGLGIGLATAAETAPVAHSDDVGAAISDTVITAKVKSKLAGDKYLKSSKIDVTTTNGVVTLTGSAAGPKSKAAAEKPDRRKGQDRDVRQLDHHQGEVRAAGGQRHQGPRREGRDNARRRDALRLAAEPGSYRPRENGRRQGGFG